MDCKAVADVAVSKFERVISLLGRTRTGHARFRRAPPATSSPAPPPPVVNKRQEIQVLETNKVYYATPIEQIPPHLPLPVVANQHHDYGMVMSKNGVIERKDSCTTINFSYSSVGKRQESQVVETNKVYYATPIQQIPPPPPHLPLPVVANQHHDYGMVMPKNGVIERKDSCTTINSSFMSSLTGDTDSKQPSSSSAFQITNLSQVSSGGKPPLSSSSLKRKSSSENLGSGKGGASSGRCHCSKKRCLSLFHFH